MSKLILSVRAAVTGGVLLLRHHLFHHASDCHREWGEGEVFLRCQRCLWRSGGVQPGPLRLATRLPGHAARHRLRVSA
jgi:hypothetical protein